MAARKTVTVVFSDIANFTPLGEALDPEVMRKVMEQYYAVVRRELERHGGTVEKFIGDAAMAVFGIRPSTTMTRCAPYAPPWICATALGG